MARSTKVQAVEAKKPPNPKNRAAFENWLSVQPRECSIAIAVRAALRVIPLVRDERNLPIVILDLFRATAIARLVARYPIRATSYPYADAAKGAVRGATRMVASSSAAKAAARTAYAAAHVAAAAYTQPAAHVAHAATEAVAAAASAADEIFAAVEQDARNLHYGATSVERLMEFPLWPPRGAPRGLEGAWEGLKSELSSSGPHWSVWISWYDDVYLGALHSPTNEIWDACFTDVPGKLHWEEGAKVVNEEIARRLSKLEHYISEPTDRLEEETIARLAELASPQPSITDKGQLDAGPNKRFDIPIVDDDLSTLPIRQRNLIRGILSDLPENAPRHLKNFLRSYAQELKARGAQPILGLLKDDADIIVAAVATPRAEEEWLEPGMRKAFDLFAENHRLFVEHFPLDPQRERIYAQTPVDESKAAGKELERPFETVKIATDEARKAGEVTDNFVAAVNGLAEVGKIVATLPPDEQAAPRMRSAEITVSPEDRIVRVTVKKRTILGALGFFKSALNKIDERNFNLAASGIQIATTLHEPLRQAIQLLSRFLM